MSTPISGLASGFDWSTFIDKIISADSAPITALQAQQTKNTSKVTALGNLSTDFTSLQTAVTALNDPTLFAGRTATSSTSGSTWSINASSGSATGTFNIAVSQLASGTKLTGASGLAKGLSATSDVSGITLATLPTAASVTAGVFTVNGAQVTIATTDTLKQVFDKIALATSGPNAVTATYDPVSDKINFASASPIVLGAANDTSNFLSVTRLANNGSGSITSASALGRVSQTATLANSNLKNPITAVDGSGNGSFLINGAAIIFNVNTDSINSVINKINSSTAGVTANYDSTNDRLILTNKTTGSVGLTTTDVAGGFLSATGVRGVSATLGNNALYTVDGGPTLSSTTNTLDASSHGITGLSLTVNSNTTQSVTVSSDTTAAKAAINTFIAKYNVLQTNIESATKLTSTNGKVTTSVLSDDREVQSWRSSLRANVFGGASGVSGVIQRMADLGIDFTAGTSQLAVKDNTKLDTALRDHPSDVQAFFTTGSTGFAATITKFISTVVGNGSGNGLIDAQNKTFNENNTRMTAQIDTINRQLTAERARLVAGFTAMEQANSANTAIQQQLTKTFG